VTRAGRVAILTLAAAVACTAKAGDDSRAPVREFDGARAFTYAERQVAFGPRVPNSPAHRAMGDWLAAELATRADTVIVQSWRHTTGRGRTLELRNFFARFRPDATDRVLYVAHWDTRPVADKDANLGRQRLPIDGANDGASGVALLLGIADALKARPPALGVDLLFVDGEDYGDFSDSTETLLGAYYFAAHRPAGYQPLFALVFDMIGDKDLQLYYEGNSQSFAPEVVKRVWQTAERIGYSRTFIHGVRHTLIDDHIPLQRVGIHAIDLIDYDYGPNNAYWHTGEDTIDKIAGESLAIVGNVAIALVR
jgi:Zn-dependent M28 family amino/carboxypeptidase